MKEFGRSQCTRRSPQSPNQQLGLAYAVENAKSEHPMQIVPITRVGSGHLDDELDKTAFASGTALHEKR